MKNDLSRAAIFTLVLLLPPVGACLALGSGKIGAAGRLAACIYTSVVLFGVLLMRTDCGSAQVAADSWQRIAFLL